MYSDFLFNVLHRALEVQSVENKKTAIVKHKRHVYCDFLNYHIKSVHSRIRLFLN
jgi:hypothetical protein